jgi:Nif-specific regulatory protein
MSLSAAPTTADLDRKALAALLDASRAVNEQIELGHVFEQVTTSAAEVLDAEAASLLLLDSARGQLVFETATGPAAAALKGTRMPAGEGIAGQVVQSGSVLRVDDVRQNRNFYSEIDQQTAMRTNSLIAAPVIYRGQTLGVIEVLNPRGRTRFSDHDSRILEIFANLVASAMRSAQTLERVSRENQAFRGSAKTPDAVGESRAFAASLDLCKRVAPTTTTVLLTGETGTGKEVSARLIHRLSTRKDKPFVPVNCAALAETLLESELFGHEKGAYTGADKERRGWFELADGGTLFLDEIGEVKPSTQAKLLRVLQEREFTRVGGSKTIVCDIRVIAATNRDLQHCVADGSFREDLFYRLSVFPIHLPPLRERAGDVPLLVDHLVRQIGPHIGVPVPTVNDDAMAALARYRWPGNVRELRNIIERATLLCDGRITLDHLPREVREPGAHAPPPAAMRPSAAPTRPGAAAPTPAPASSAPASIDPALPDAFAQTASPAPTDATDPSAAAAPSSLAAHERTLILNALSQANWNQSAAARALGITRDVLRYRMKKHTIEPPAGV